MHGLPKEEDKYNKERRITYRKLQTEIEQRSSETLFQFGASKGLGNEYAFQEMTLPYLLPYQ